MNDRVKSVLDKLLEAFKENKIPQAVAYQKFPIPNIPCRQWSFLNQLMVILSDTEDARGYNQWKEVNRFVKKGAKSIDILVPLFKKSEEDEDILALKGFMCRPVFRYEDTDGEKLDFHNIELPDLPLLDKAKQWGLNVKAIGGSETNYGYYVPSRKEICLCTPEEKTLFHEIAHYADEQTNGKLKIKQDPWQEIVAELSAQALCQIIGRTMDSHLGNSYDYIAYYSEKVNMTPYTAVLQVLGRIDKVLTFILK